MPWRVALVGFGISGSVFHGPLLAAAPSYRVDAVVTSNPERRAAAQAMFPQATIVHSYQELLDGIDDGRLAVDLVVLGTPPAGHREESLAAVARGLALVVDKPFAASAADARVIVEAAEAAGTLLTVFQNRRWDGDFLTLRQAIDDGVLGTVRSFESRFEWWMPGGFGTWRDAVTARQGGGILFDLGSHLVDQALQLFGPARPVLAQLRSHPESFASGADTDSFLVLEHESGVTSRLWMSMLAPMEAPRFTVQGSRAGFRSRGLDPQEGQLAAGLTPTDPGYGVPQEPFLLSAGAEHRHLEPARGDYPAFYRRLAGALAGDGEVPVPPREALAVVDLLEAARTAAPTPTLLNR